MRALQAASHTKLRFAKAIVSHGSRSGSELDLKLCILRHLQQRLITASGSMHSDKQDAWVLVRQHVSVLIEDMKSHALVV